MDRTGNQPYGIGPIMRAVAATDIFNELPLDVQQRAQAQLGERLLSEQAHKSAEA